MLWFTLIALDIYLSCITQLIKILLSSFCIKVWVNSKGDLCVVTQQLKPELPFVEPKFFQKKTKLNCKNGRSPRSQSWRQLDETWSAHATRLWRLEVPRNSEEAHKASRGLGGEVLGVQEQHQWRFGDFGNRTWRNQEQNQRKYQIKRESRRYTL